MRLVVVAICLCVCGCCKKKESVGTEQASAAPAVTVGASELFRDYKDNEVRADTKYKGKRLRLTGIVGEVKKDITDSIYVIVGTGAALEIPSAQCSFDDDQTSRVAALSKGDKVTVECTCDGLMMNVTMHDCVIPSAFATAPMAGGKAMSVCKKLESAGVGSNCSQKGADETVKFEYPKGKGIVMVLSDDASYSRVTSPAGAPAMSKFDCFGSAKEHTLVCLMKGSPAGLGPKAKAVVDAL